MTGLGKLAELAEGLMIGARADPLPRFKEFRQACLVLGYREPDLEGWLWREWQDGYTLACDVEVNSVSSRLTAADDLRKAGNEYVDWVWRFIQRAQHIDGDRSALERYYPSAAPKHSQD